VSHDGLRKPARRGGESGSKLPHSMAACGG